MANKRIVLREGFFVTDGGTKRCHYSEVTTTDMWGDTSEEYLVIMDGSVSIVGRHKNALHRTEDSANRNHMERRAKHRKFCEEQIANYQNQLTEE